MLTAIKRALRLTVSAYDDELNQLIAAGKADLRLAGIDTDTVGDNDPLIVRAVVTYCKMHFGTPTDYDRLKSSYDEQKAQLQTAFTYLGGDD